MAARKKSTKKSSRSTARSSSLESYKASDLSKSTPSSEVRSMPLSARLKQRKYIILFVVIVVLILLFALRGYFVAALVNGQPISRLTVISELEKQGGKQIMQSLVQRELILQEAKKRNVTLTQDDINKDLAKIEESYKQQGQTLDQVLTSFGVSKEEVIEQRRPWILLEKMVGKDVAVTDAEVAKFIESNNEAYGGTLKPEDVKRDLTAEKLNQKQQEFIEKLQKNAKINYFVQY